jgi:hypothetical protein
MVDQPYPAGHDSSFRYFDIGESAYHWVRVLDIRRDGKWLRLRVAANDGEDLFNAECVSVAAMALFQPSNI